MTHLKRGIIFLSYSYSERIIWWCLYGKRWQQTVSKGLRKMDMVVDELHFRSHVYRWWKANCKPPRSKWTAWSKCLSVFVSVCTRMSYHLFGGWWRAWEHIIVTETGQMTITGAYCGRKLRTDLQCISWRHLKQNGHLKFLCLKKDNGYIECHSCGWWNRECVKTAINCCSE